MYDLVLPETSRARYDDLLQEAAQERRALQVARTQDPSWVERILLHLSQWLIDTGIWLKARVELRPDLSQP